MFMQLSRIKKESKNICWSVRIYAVPREENSCVLAGIENTTTLLTANLMSQFSTQQKPFFNRNYGILDSIVCKGLGP